MSRQKSRVTVGGVPVGGTEAIVQRDFSRVCRYSRCELLHYLWSFNDSAGFVCVAFCRRAIVVESIAAKGSFIMLAPICNLTVFPIKSFQIVGILCFLLVAIFNFQTELHCLLFSTAVFNPWSLFLEKNYSYYVNIHHLFQKEKN